MLNVIVNGKLVAAETDNLKDFLDSLPNMPEQYAISLNNEIVSKKNFATTCIHDGDEIEIFVMMAGG